MNKERSDDRVLVLRPIEGKNAMSSTGLVDKRLFNGGNKMHLLLKPGTTLWYFKYEEGIVPEHFKQYFTGFNTALKYAREYFLKRNIEIVEVID